MLGRPADATDLKRARAEVIPVRVVEYEVEDPGRPQAEDTRYRLITTVLDADDAPAAELAAFYAERWEFESALDELLRGFGASAGRRPVTGH